MKNPDQALQALKSEATILRNNDPGAAPKTEKRIACQAVLTVTGYRLQSVSRREVSAAMAAGSCAGARCPVDCKIQTMCVHWKE